MSDRTAYLSRSQDDAQVSYQFQRQQLDSINAYVDKRWGPDNGLEFLGGVGGGGVADLSSRFDRFHLTSQDGGGGGGIWEGQAAYPWDIPTSAAAANRNPAVSSGSNSSGWPPAVSAAVDIVGGSSEHAVSQPIDMSTGVGGGGGQLAQQHRHGLVQSQDQALSPNSKDLIAMGMKIVDQFGFGPYMTGGTGGGGADSYQQQQQLSNMMSYGLPYHLLFQQQQQQQQAAAYKAAAVDNKDSVGFGLFPPMFGNPDGGSGGGGFYGSSPPSN
uniref:PUM-HD domain-containing protein n=1 Tax=Macrostomum lignano TaxID=282301 RepID=A0A1I8G2N1_9PLAT